MEQPLQPQPETKASVASDLEESGLVGVPVALAGDVDMADRDGDCCLPSLDVSVVDDAVLKRKRGRPARGAPKTAPPVRPKKDEEDVCFVCFDGGSLVLCDRRCCPKAYHPACIKRDEAFFRSKAKWNCGWHICSVCQKAAHYLCYTCTYSLCKRCTRGTDFICVRENKGLCGICMRTIMLIENSAQGNKEKCEVDFDDKTSWEYLFKVYWMYLKGKLSLTFDELIQAKNACKGAAAISCKDQTPHELCHVKDDKGSGSENSCIDIESNNSKKRKSKPRLFSNGDCGISLPDDSLNDRSWHYQDPTGKIQGPFSLLQLYKWNASGYFPPDLRIWRIDEKQHNSILLTDALSGKCSKTVSLPFNSQLLSLGVNVTLDNKVNIIHNAVRNESKKEISADSQIIKQSREQRVDDTSTLSNGKDESVRSNGLWDQLHLCPSILSTAFPEKLNDNPSDKLRKGHGIEGNSEDNGNNASNRTSDGQSNSGQTNQKQSDSEENSRQSSGQNWRHTSENSSSSCLFTRSAHVCGTETSLHKLGFDLHNPPSPPACNTSTRQATIGEPNDFDESVSDNPPSPPACNTSTWQAIIGEPTDFDESVSDLLAEVEAMESLGGLESPTSMIICGEELTVGSKNHCFSFVEMLDVGKGDALSSTGDLNLPSQSIAAEEPLQQADILHHQRLFWEHSSRTSKVEVGTKNVSVSSNQWESRSENSPVVPSPATSGLAIDTTWRLGSQNTHFGWSGIDQENANMDWGICQTQMAVQENRSSNSYTSAVTQGSGDSQTRYGTDRFSVPRDRGFQGHGRELGFGRDRIAYNRQSLCGVGSGDSYRPLPKGQRVCKFYESGYCKKGASCDYLHQ